MSTVYLGTSQFAAAVLERLAGAGRHRPALVITRPDRPAGRGRRVSSPPVAQAALRLGLALEQPQSVNDPAVAALVEAAAPGERPTVIVCAFGALIKEPLLSAYEILNVHPSLLPRWRGAAPVERAIMAGDERTGVSIMRLTAGLDSGPVCLQEAEPINPTDDYGTLSARLQTLGGELLVRALEESPPFSEQPEDGVTYAEKIAAGDRLLDPGRPAVELERQVRALHPHIGARLALGEEQALGVRRACLAGDRPPPPGELAGAGERLLLGCDPGTLELLEVQPARGASDGRRGLPTGSRRARPSVGADVLGQLDAGSQQRVGLRCPDAQRERDDPGPGIELVVLLVVEGRPGANLRRGLLDGESDDRRRAHLVVGRRADFVPAARNDPFHDRPEGRSLLERLGDLACFAEDDRRAVVGRVVHRRAGQHEPVDQRDRQACPGAACHRAHRPPGAGTVAVDDIAVPGVERRHRQGLAVVHHDRQVSDQGLVEDRVDRPAIVAAALTLAAQADPLGSRRGRVRLRSHCWPLSVIVQKND